MPGYSTFGWKDGRPVNFSHFCHFQMGSSTVPHVMGFLRYLVGLGTIFSAEEDILFPQVWWTNVPLLRAMREHNARTHPVFDGIYHPFMVIWQVTFMVLCLPGWKVPDWVASGCTAEQTSYSSGRQAKSISTWFTWLETKWCVQWV